MFATGSKSMEVDLGARWHNTCEELFGVSFPIFTLQILRANMTGGLCPGQGCAVLLPVAVACENSWVERPA